MNTNLPIKKKDNILVKIKKFFLRLFNKQEIYSEYANNQVLNSKMNNSSKTFLEEIKVKDISKKFFLKRKLESKEMHIYELSDEELDEMIEFYENFIKEKRSVLKGV